MKLAEHHDNAPRGAESRAAHRTGQSPFLCLGLKLHAWEGREGIKKGSLGGQPGHL